MRIHRKPVPPPFCTRPVCRVPPSPRLMRMLHAKYLELLDKQRIPRELTFKQFFDVWVCDRRGDDVIGLDDGSLAHGPAKPVELIARPKTPLRGTIPTIALLVDFPDCRHDPKHTPAHYRKRLFGTRKGSMRHYYRSVSQGPNAIDIDGRVHGWFTLPKPMAYYADAQSGLGKRYPRTAMHMARDAVLAAIDHGVDFHGYDALGEDIVTALFIVHAGSGAEDSGLSGDIWSHKGLLPRPVHIDDTLRVSPFLTVPEDCTVGVCAHEWGHLAARWGDYYDTGDEEQGELVSNGPGQFCLMSYGEWADNGRTPTLPNAMLRAHHGWIRAELVQENRTGVELRPAAEGGHCLLVFNPRRMKPTQYILVEYRRKRAQDKHVPDQGIAVYVVDEEIEDVNDENLLAIELMQADGKRDLARVTRARNEGDDGDLYPYKRKRELGRKTAPPLNLSDRTTWSGVTLRVHGTPGAATMRVDIEIAA